MTRIRRYHHTQNLQPLEMAEKTLVKMRLGGIFDQVGFGFHRYSTDAQWLVPHFEKMLYDQSMLIMVYTEAYQATGKEFYARTAAEIITYVLREMTSAVGGFYSAEDADSEGIEGKFYLWTPQEIQDILGKKDAALINSIFNVKDGGNFKDDKILTDWNGLMIAALAKAGSVLNNKTYIAAAAKASDFILQNLSDANGRLLKRYRKGKAGLPGHLNDYAFMVWGLLELYQAVFETKYLKSAIEINNDMLSHFWDEQNGGLYMTADDGEKLLVRSKVIYDGAIPSGNSVAMFNLLRLGHITGKADYLTKAERIIKSFSASVKQYPAGFSQLMVALEFTLNPNYEVVVVGDPGKKDTASMLAALRKPFLPEKVVLFRPADQSAATDITALAPFTRSMAAKKGQATAYVCQEFACKLPTTSIDQMLKNLRQN